MNAMTSLEPTSPTFVTAASGSYRNGAATFPSLTEFTRARPARARSRERDYGLAWRDGTNVYRAAWIADTGELYIVQLGDPEDGGGHVELLATGGDLEQTRRALLGWRTACGREESLGWLRERAGDRLPAPDTTRQQPAPRRRGARSSG
jgi:hypothetical protein